MIGLVVGGVGVIGLGVGTVFALQAKSNNDQALQNCRTPTLCSPMGLSLTNDAKNAATAADVAFGVGAAALAAGAVLWLTAPHASATGLRAVPVVARSYGGLAIDAAW
jgi:serine/threonine-protein kinase